MKNKLKKDLRFLKYFIVKVITAFAFSFLRAILDFMDAIKSGVKDSGDSEAIFGFSWFVWFFIFFIAIYFFIAWLYGEDETENK